MKDLLSINLEGQNYARIAYLNVSFHMLGICLSDLPGNYTSDS